MGGHTESMQTGMLAKLILTVITVSLGLIACNVAGMALVWLLSIRLF